MRYADGTLTDLTAALNEAIVELGAPITPADGTLASATSQLNALLVWYGSELDPADGTLASATTQYNLFVGAIVVGPRFYMVPVEEGTVANQFGPKYFRWRFDPDPPGIVNWNMMRMGNLPHALVVAHDISRADHDALILNSDVYAFPENLDAPITDPAIDAFFEGLHLPTDWLTPSTAYRELLRSVAGIIQFNQRYKGIAAAETGELHSIFDSATLDTRLRQMTPQEEEWFYQTVESFGFNRSIVNRNAQLRLLVRQGASYWDDKTFIMGGFEF